MQELTAAMHIGMALDRYRLTSTGTPWDSRSGDPMGAFIVPGPCGSELKVIASPGDEEVRWEHVSVSLKNRCSNWTEMCFVRDLFWPPDVAVMQLHPPKSDYVNTHNYCLHLWRPLDVEIPRPPIGAV